MFEKLMNFKALEGTKQWMRRHQAFNSKRTWYDFLNSLIEKISSNDFSERASAVAFNLFLAVFPAIIFLFTLIPYVPIDNLDDRIMNLLRRAIPAGTYEAVYTTIRDIVSRQRDSVLSFGFLLTLYAATSGMVALMNAFNSSHESADQRGFLKVRMTAAGLTFVLAFGLIIAIVVLVIGGVVTDYLLQFGILNNVVVANLLSIGRYLLVFAVFVGVVSVIYRFGPDVDMKWSFVTPGSISASVLIVLVTLVFSFYVSNFGSYNKVYGSIGTLIALMVWLNLICLLLILGFEMNVSLYNLEGDKDPDPAEKKTATTNATLNT
ncbi:ribonuclease BN [Fibrisoma limi BUZ 3]|uniref:Ribonuclease BN n=1 Tax=Fibrisoma limi BUZ 3 TaxID=1185876 RepID=I2GNB6_9BACT|nr:YihY/virulence factor BrkB family protein [Fibrisoma limi]CCH55394.1 ribonuclease BN [Fibrisoma limi BUZ 3]